jgi:hypothetical protein
MHTINKIKEHYQRNRKNYHFLFLCFLVVIFFTYPSHSDYNYLTESYRDSGDYAPETGTNPIAILFMTFGLYLFGKFASIYLAKNNKN